MANIAIFRVAKKKKERMSKISSIFIIILCLILLLLIFWLFNSNSVLSYNSIKLSSQNMIQTIDSLILKSFIEDTLPIIKASNKLNHSENNNDMVEELAQKMFFVNAFDCKSVLSYQFPALQIYNFKNYSEKQQGANGQDNSNDIDFSDKNSIGTSDDEAEKQANKDTTEKTNNSIPILKSGDIRIRNHTSYKLDIEKLQNEKLKLGSGKKDTQVIILHTHSTEAYTSSKNNSYTPSEPFRTVNLDYNVIRVGKGLDIELSKLGVKAAHDTTIHDYPTYTGSYARSLQTAIKNMKQFPNAKIILDVHRDAYGSPDKKLRAVTKIGNNEVAKIMFVVGTDQLGLKHINWNENFKFAVKLQKKANELYPGLCKDIDLRKERFNQHVAQGAIIVEVGGTGNTLEEAENSMKYLAKVIAEVIK